MIKKRCTKTYNVLEKEDVERLVSEMAGCPIKLSDMEILLYDNVDTDALLEGHPESAFCTYISVSVDNGQEIIDIDDEGPLDDYMPADEAFVDLDKIFAFDVKEFKSFERESSCGD